MTYYIMKQRKHIQQVYDKADHLYANLTEEERNRVYQQTFEICGHKIGCQTYGINILKPNEKRLWAAAFYELLQKEFKGLNFIIKTAKNDQL